MGWTALTISLRYPWQQLDTYLPQTCQPQLLQRRDFAHNWIVFQLQPANQNVLHIKLVTNNSDWLCWTTTFFSKKTFKNWMPRSTKISRFFLKSTYQKDFGRALVENGTKCGADTNFQHALFRSHLVVYIRIVLLWTGNYAAVASQLKTSVN